MSAATGEAPPAARPARRSRTRSSSAIRRTSGARAAPAATPPSPATSRPRPTSCATSGGTLRGSKVPPPRRARSGARWRLSHWAERSSRRIQAVKAASPTGSADPSTRSRSDSRRRRSRAAASTRDSDTPSDTSSDPSRREPDPSSCSRRPASSPAGAGETTRRPGATFTRATESAPAKKLTPSLSSTSPRRASPPNASAPCSRSRACRSRGSTPFGPSSRRATRSSRAGAGSSSGGRTP